MQKPYETPRLTGIMQQNEGVRRELLATLFLTVPPTEKWLFGRAIKALIDTETICMHQNCHRLLSDHAAPYCQAELISLCRDLLTAADVLLRERGVSLSLSVIGVPTIAAVFPRLLQFGIVSLLSAAQSPGNTASVSVTVTRSRFRLIVTADQPLNPDQNFPLCQSIATLHGGRLLLSDHTVGLEFIPTIKPSTDLRWHSPGIDGLVKNPFSVVRLAFYSSSAENNSCEGSSG